ncbi:MAG: exodeoxyribonuclease VII large subunit [Lysobacteraceae bacterium]
MSDLLASREAPTRVLSPSQLNTLARDLLEGSFPAVWVEGEISNLARPGSGHIYLTLKDARAQLRCAMFRPKSSWLRFQPANGMQVLVRGRLSLYDARGDYQLILDHMEEAGDGALRRAFEELKRRLDAEGLFDETRKQVLPKLVRRLGILSSPTGAAIRDVLSVLSRRFPLLDVELLPVPVQGAEAPAKIADMLRRADASGRYDAILITRGGGSLEDLAAFNNEALARAIADCRTPVVSAVGHEVDFSICDFVADLRAPTPSAAAELLVPDRHALAQRLDALSMRLQRHAGHRLQSLRLPLSQLRQRLQAASPQRSLKQGGERLRDLHRRLQVLRLRPLRDARLRIDGLHARLLRQHPANELPQRRQHLQRLLDDLRRPLLQRLRGRAERLSGLARALNAVNPLATLERGYAILDRENGGVITDAREVKVDERLRARLAHGELTLRVEATDDGDNHR